MGLHHVMEDLGASQWSWLWTGVLAVPLTWYAYCHMWQRAAPKDRGFEAFLRPGAPPRPTGDAKVAAAKKKKQRSPTVFGSFLHDDSLQPRKPLRDPASFSSFLRQPVQADAESLQEADAQVSSAEGPPPDSKALMVLYGTEYGFSKEIAEKLAEKLRDSSGFWPQLIDMADNPEGLPLDKEQALLVVCSTQGDGVPPSEAREFCDWLAGSSAPRLEQLHFSVCALGDTSYTHFCACGRAVDARLEELGGSRFALRVDVNREDWKAVDTWIDSVVAGLADLPLKTVGSFPGQNAKVAAAAPKQKRWSKSRPYFGTVLAFEGLCNIASADDKDTIRVEVDLGDSALTYTPGDALGILPYNCPQAVDELLEELGASGEARVPVPSWHYEEERPRNGQDIPLRDALLLCYDLRSPKPALLQTLLETLQQRAKQKQKQAVFFTGTAQHISSSGIVTDHSATNGHSTLSNGHAGSAKQNGFSHAHEEELGEEERLPKHAERLQKHAEQLQKLLASGDAAIEAYFKPRHVLDVLRDFDTARPTVEQVLPTLRPLLPRLYSISSSQLENAHTVQITVAVVRYESLGRQRIGVASTYLAERLKVGDRVPVYIHKNPDFRLPSSPSTPIIMVGPGTGLAPFRAFMQERLLGSAPGSPALGRAVLYFGCRRRDQDYLYGQLLEEWAQQGKLTLFTAFSREQAHKIYVQDRLRESADLVWELLEGGAHFYVCGDAAHMAGAVERALLDCIARAQGKGPESAKAYLDAMTAQQRYQRDIWY